jgi:hypothetical protein
MITPNLTWQISSVDPLISFYLQVSCLLLLILTEVHLHQSSKMEGSGFVSIITNPGDQKTCGSGTPNVFLLSSRGHIRKEQEPEPDQNIKDPHILFTIAKVESLTAKPNENPAFANRHFPCQVFLVTLPTAKLTRQHRK